MSSKFFRSVYCQSATKRVVSQACDRHSMTQTRGLASVVNQIPEYDAEYDVVVVGSGAAGLTAALTAASHGGRKVLVVERTGLYGGTTAFSGGACWLPMNTLSVAAGSKDTRALVKRYLRSTCDKDYKEELVTAYLDAAPEMLNFLESKCGNPFTAVPVPDYYMQHDGAQSTGRTVFTNPFDARKLGRKVLKQIRYQLQGYVIGSSFQVSYTNMAHFTKPFANLQSMFFLLRSFLRYSVDKVLYGRGTVFANGNALIGHLMLAAITAKVEMWNDTCALEPILEQGRVTGITIVRGGRVSKIRARNAVVLAGGGFARSAELTRKLLPTSGHTVGPRGNTGQGIRIGIAAGGYLPRVQDVFDTALWTPISEHRLADGTSRTYPHFTIGLTKPGSIIVDADGNRFANESAVYQDLGRATHLAGVSRQWLIADRRHLRKYGMGIALPHPYPVGHLKRRGYLIEAGSVAALATKLRIDPERLAATVEKFNGYARNGKDEDFGRGEGSYDKGNGDPEVGPNNCLAPLEQGPFYAVPMYPGVGVTTIGLITNKDGCVLKSTGKVVPNLYAVGADGQHFLNGRYPSGGLTLGPSLVFAYRAALHLSSSDS